MKTIKNVCVFNKYCDQNGVKFTNTDEEIISMLENSPIIQDGVGEEVKVVGSIKEVTKVEDGKFFGDIFIMHNCSYNDFYNCEYTCDKFIKNNEGIKTKITSIMGIYFI